MKLYTTITELKAKHACYDNEQWTYFMTKMNLTSEDQSFDIASGLKVAGIKDCVWALCTQKGKDIAGFAASIAYIVLPIYQKRYPSDKRIRRCISLTYKYAVGLCSKEDLKKAAAYTDAYTAADAYAAAANAAAIVAYNGVYANAADVKIWKSIEELFIQYFSE